MVRTKVVFLKLDHFCTENTSSHPPRVSSMASDIPYGQQIKGFLSILSTSSSYQSPFCLNVPYIPGLGKQFCTAATCMETFDNVKRAGWRQDLDFFTAIPLQGSRTWWEEVGPWQLQHWLGSTHSCEHRSRHGDVSPTDSGSCSVQ